MPRYKISRFLGTDGDGNPEHIYTGFYADSDDEAIERYEREKAYYKHFSGFLTKEISEVITSNVDKVLKVNK